MADALFEELEKGSLVCFAWKQISPRARVSEIEILDRKLRTESDGRLNLLVPQVSRITSFHFISLCYIPAKI